ncbi:MAG: DUF6314 family protein [Aliishimia sp.]
MPTDRSLLDFQGEWTLHKTIQQTGQPNAIYTGQAVWHPCAKGLQYEESGTLTITGHTPMQTTRRYLWTDGLNVFFDDGRFFHTVPPNGGATQHVCPPDDYNVLYDFTTWPRFQVIWRVQGPRKDYVMTANYAPLHPAPVP